MLQPVVEEAPLYIPGDTKDKCLSQGCPKDVRMGVYETGQQCLSRAINYLGLWGNHCFVTDGGDCVTLEHQSIVGKDAQTVKDTNMPKGDYSILSRQNLPPL